MLIYSLVSHHNEEYENENVECVFDKPVDVLCYCLEQYIEYQNTCHDNTTLKDFFDMDNCRIVAWDTEKKGQQVCSWTWKQFENAFERLNNSRKPNE